MYNDVDPEQLKAAEQMQDSEESMISESFIFIRVKVKLLKHDFLYTRRGAL